MSNENVMETGHIIWWVSERYKHVRDSFPTTCDKQMMLPLSVWARWAVKTQFQRLSEGKNFTMNYFSLDKSPLDKIEIDG